MFCIFRTKLLIKWATRNKRLCSLRLNRRESDAKFHRKRHRKMTTEVIKAGKDYTRNLFEYPEKFKLKTKPVYARHFHHQNSNNHSATTSATTATATTTNTSTSASNSTHNEFANATIPQNGRAIKAKSASVTRGTGASTHLNRVSSAAAAATGSKSSLTSNPSYDITAKRYNKQVTISTSSIDNSGANENNNANSNAVNNKTNGMFLTFQALNWSFLNYWVEYLDAFMIRFFNEVKTRFGPFKNYYIKIRTEIKEMVCILSQTFFLKASKPKE